MNALQVVDTQQQFGITPKYIAISYTPLFKIQVTEVDLILTFES